MKHTQSVPTFIFLFYVRQRERDRQRNRQTDREVVYLMTLSNAKIMHYP